MTFVLAHIHPAEPFALPTVLNTWRIFYRRRQVMSKHVIIIRWALQKLTRFSSRSVTNSKASKYSRESTSNVCWRSTKKWRKTDVNSQKLNHTGLKKHFTMPSGCTAIEWIYYSFYFVHIWHFLDLKWSNEIPMISTKIVQMAYTQWSISLAPASDVVWFALVPSSANRTWPAPLRFSVVDTLRSSVWH